MATSEPTYLLDTANWSPLEMVLPDEEVGMFMWMHTCVYDDSVRLEAYKHRITRQYLFLDQEGNACLPGDADSPEPVAIPDALGPTARSLALPRPAGTAGPRTRTTGWRPRPPRSGAAARVLTTHERGHLADHHGRHDRATNVASLPTGGPPTSTRRAPSRCSWLLCRRPVHPCCASHASETRGQPCPACGASRKARWRR